MERRNPNILEDNMRFLAGLKEGDEGTFTEAPKLPGDEEPRTTLVRVSIAGVSLDARWTEAFRASTP